MTAECALEIATTIAALSPFPWPDDGSKQKAWVYALAHESTADIADEVAVATVQRMLTEYAPEKLSPAQIVATCRTKPAIAPKRQVEAPPHRRIEGSRDRIRLGQEDRAALASLQRAFARRGGEEAKEFDRLMGRMQKRDGVEWS